MEGISFVVWPSDEEIIEVPYLSTDEAVDELLNIFGAETAFKGEFIIPDADSDVYPNSVRNQELKNFFTKYAGKTLRVPSDDNSYITYTL